MDDYETEFYSKIFPCEQYNLASRFLFLHANIFPDRCISYKYEYMKRDETAPTKLIILKNVCIALKKSIINFSPQFTSAGKTGIIFYWYQKQFHSYIAHFTMSD